MKDLIERLEASSDEVESHPHPSHCEHLHVAFKLMREAASALSGGIDGNTTEILLFTSALLAGILSVADSVGPAARAKADDAIRQAYPQAEQS